MIHDKKVLLTAIKPNSITNELKKLKHKRRSFFDIISRETLQIFNFCDNCQWNKYDLNPAGEIILLGHISSWRPKVLNNNWLFYKICVTAKSIKISNAFYAFNIILYHYSVSYMIVAHSSTGLKKVWWPNISRSTKS